MYINLNRGVIFVDIQKDSVSLGTLRSMREKPLLIVSCKKDAEFRNFLTRSHIWKKIPVSYPTNEE